MSKIWSFCCELLGYIHINGGLYSFWFESRFRLLEIDEKDELVLADFSAGGLHILLMRLEQINQLPAQPTELRFPVADKAGLAISLKLCIAQLLSSLCFFDAAINLFSHEVSLFASHRIIE